MASTRALASMRRPAQAVAFLLALAMLHSVPFVGATSSKTMTLPAPIDDKTLDAVLHGTGWQRAHVRITDDEGFPALSSPRCRFYSASNDAVPGAGLMRFVLDGQGALLAHSGNLETLATLLRTCMPPDASALVWAQTLARFSSITSPAVVESDDKLTQAAIPAGRYRPPIKRVVDGETLIEFFAQRPDRRVFLIKAALPASGPVRIDTQRVQAD